MNAETERAKRQATGFPPSLGGDWRWFALFLVAATFIAYQPVWHAGFIWDDDKFLTENPVIKGADGLYRIWFTKSTPDYYPITSSTMWLEWRIWGGQPLGFHLVNVLLHGLSAVLLWRALERLKIPGAMLAGAIFALHPVNVESVAWITERKNTLAMFFYLGAVLSWLNFEDRCRRRWYVLALGGFTLGLLSKTAVAPFPFVLLALAWWRRGCVRWQDVRRTLPFFVLAAVLGVVTILFQYGAISYEVVRPEGFWSRLAGAGWAVWFYLYKAVVPLNLIFVYPRWQIDPHNMWSYVPLFLLAAAFVLCWRNRVKWGKKWLFGLIYFVVMLLPVLGFLNIYFMLYSLVADHWQYFAIVSPIALASAGIHTFFRSWRSGGQFWGRAFCTVLLATLGLLTWRQCQMYADVATLWQTTIDRNPGCWLAHNNLGVLMADQGKTDEAIRQFNKTLELKPDYARAHNNLGLAFAKEGKLVEAVQQYEVALQLKPDAYDAHFNLGLALAEQGKPAEAIQQYDRAIQLKPDDAKAHYNLGLVLAKQGRLSEAIQQYDAGLQIKPDDAEAHYNLANALAKQGNLVDAISHYQRALQLNPDDAGARNNLGLALAGLGRPDEAVQQFQRALLSKPDFADAHFNLGLVLANQGKQNEAMQQLRQALTLATAQNQTNMAEAIRRALKSYP